jgi:hypothetical protein
MSLSTVQFRIYRYDPDADANRNRDTDDRSGLRQRRNGDGMPVAEENANESRDDHDEQSAHEEISGNHEGSAGVVHSAQVENGDDQENSEAQRNRVWLQGRNRGNEGADSRGDANGGGEDVVG